MIFFHQKQWFSPIVKVLKDTWSNLVWMGLNQAGDQIRPAEHLWSCCFNDWHTESVSDWLLSCQVLQLYSLSLSNSRESAKTSENRAVPQAVSDPPRPHHPIEFCQVLQQHQHIILGLDQFRTKPTSLWRNIKLKPTDYYQPQRLSGAQTNKKGGKLRQTHEEGSSCPTRMTDSRPFTRTCPNGKWPNSHSLTSLSLSVSGQWTHVMKCHGCLCLGLNYSTVPTNREISEIKN